MNAGNVLRVAQAAGIQVAVDGDDLVLTAPTQPPADVLDLLARNKGAIITLLRSANEGLPSKDLQELFDEQAKARAALTVVINSLGRPTN